MFDKMTDEQIEYCKRFLVSAICAYFGPAGDPERKYALELLKHVRSGAMLYEAFSLMMGAVSDPDETYGDLYDIMREWRDLDIALEVKSGGKNTNGK